MRIADFTQRRKGLARQSRNQKNFTEANEGNEEQEKFCQKCAILGNSTAKNFCFLSVLASWREKFILLRIADCGLKADYPGTRFTGPRFHACRAVLSAVQSTVTSAKVEGPAKVPFGVPPSGGPAASAKVKGRAKAGPLRVKGSTVKGSSPEF